MPAVTDADFADVVEGATSGLVLVDFWAPWCVPCEKLTPVVQALAAEHAGTLTVVAMDVDANPVASARHAVLSLPTLILFRGGQEVARVTGTASEKKVRKALAAHLAP